MTLDGMTTYEQGLRRALAIAEMFADENMRMADDTIQLDPILNSRRRAEITSPEQLAAAAKVSERLELEGFQFASRSHAAKDIVDAIRAELGERVD